MKAPRNKWRCADRLVDAVMVVVVVAGMFAVGVVVEDILAGQRAAGLPRSPATMQPG